MKLDRKTLEAVFSSRVTVLGTAYNPGGGEEVLITVNTFEKYVDDYRQFCADHYGVPLETYERWLDTHGQPQCGATTTSGKRCKKQSGPSQSTITEWLRLEGGWCRYHDPEDFQTKMRRLKQELAQSKQNLSEFNL